MKDKFTTVCIIGMPRSGTTHLVASLQDFGNGNFVNCGVDNIVHSSSATNSAWGQNVSEHDGNIKQHIYLDYKYKAIKSPLIINQLDFFMEDLLTLKALEPNTLFLVCTRNYNDALFSLHSLWKDVWKDTPDKPDTDYDDDYIVFLQNKVESHRKIEENIIKCKKLLKDIVVISYEDTILKTHPEKIISDLNIDYHNEKHLEWEPYNFNLQEEQSQKFVNLDLEEAYLRMLSNPEIKSITYQNKKVDWL